MATKTALQILGLDELDGDVVGTTTDGAQQDPVNPRPSKIAMMKGLPADYSLAYDRHTHN